MVAPLPKQPFDRFAGGQRQRAALLVVEVGAGGAMPREMRMQQETRWKFLDSPLLAPFEVALAGRQPLDRVRT